MFKKFTSAAIAASLLLTACAALPVQAEEKSDFVIAMPKWVPNSYEEAREFYYAHGTTYVQDGMICMIRLTNKNRSDPFQEAADTMTMLYQETFTAEAPSESDPDWVEQNGRTAETNIVVTVYEPKESGKHTVRWILKTTPERITTFTFEKTAACDVIETDIYGWMPDCMTEYEAFKEAHGTLSVVENYIVYCGNINYSTGADMELTTEGSGEAKLLTGTSIHDPFAIEAPGTTSHIMQIYEPSKAGKLGMHFAVGISAYPESIETTSGYYKIADDMTVTEITAEEMSEDIDVPEPYGLGDADGDGDLTVLDVVMLQKYILGTGTLTAPEYADLNGDGTVDVFDLALAKRALLQKQQEPEKVLDVPFDALHQKTGGIVDHENYEAQSNTAKLITSYEEFAPYLEKDGKHLKLSAEDAAAFFADHAIVVVETKATSSSVFFDVTGMERQGSNLTVKLISRAPETALTDLAARRLYYAVDKNAVDGVTGTEVQYEALRSTLVHAKNMTKSDYGALSQNAKYQGDASVVICNTLEEYRANIWEDANLATEPDEAFFADKCVALIRSCGLSSSAKVRMTGMVREGDTVTVELLREQPQNPSPDMWNHLFVYSINKSELEGVKDYKIEMDSFEIVDPGMDY